MEWILKTLELWSGLKINFEKSNIINLGELGCWEKGFWDAKGLVSQSKTSVFQSEKKLKKEDWMEMIDKIQKKYIKRLA